MGSSPRVRGKHSYLVAVRVPFGLIPACAGKTERRLPVARECQAHPRVCGENRWRDAVVLILKGSSPRVRGKHYVRWVCFVCLGLIPACAGKTVGLCVFHFHRSAHPRVCGENFTLIQSLDIDVGSSPRVRGKLHSLGCAYFDQGLIPACAGKTTSLEFTRLRAWAHPRVCGENAMIGTAVAGAAGSSPRVRGKR